MKVFVGEKFRTQLYILHDNGGVEVVTHDFLAAKVIEYFKQHLPPLSAEEAEYVKTSFCIKT